MLEYLFKEIDKHLGLNVSKVEKGLLGPYLLKIGDQFDVWIKELGPGIVLKSVICPLSNEGDKESLFSYLMRANYIGQGTGGCIIAIDPDEKFLTLSLIMTYDVNYRIFRDKIENFVNYLDFWISEIKRLETGQI